MTPFCGARFRIGDPSARSAVPWKFAGKNPFPQFAAPPCGWLTSGSTTNAGRSLFSDPSPYVTHAPTAGSPAKRLPVLTCDIAVG